MRTSNGKKSGVSSVVFAASVVLLLILAAGGFTLYASKPSVTSTVTETATATRTVPATTQTEVMNHTATMTETMTAVRNQTMTEMIAEPAIPFTPAKGQMIHDAWLITAPLGNGTYALTIHAQGLEGMSMGAYIVEGTQHGTKVTVPIGGQNATLSEFEADSHGNGQFFIILQQNPATAYDTISLVFLPGMQMTNATVAATAHVGM
jgi:hypothetical protein